MFRFFYAQEAIPTSRNSDILHNRNRSTFVAVFLCSRGHSDESELRYPPQKSRNTKCCGFFSLDYLLFNFA
jgi:hypothetical protein